LPSEVTLDLVAAAGCRRILRINFGGSIWCINVYADIFHRGEGTPMHVEHLRDAWNPLESYRSNYDGRKHGIAYLAMNKNFKRLAMRVNNHHAVTLLHGQHCKSTGVFAKYRNRDKYGLNDEPHRQIWQARHWLPFNDKTVWYPYYRNPGVVSLEPENLLSSLFVSSDRKRALLVISNLDPDAIKDASVTVDSKKVGLAAGQLKIEDVVLGSSIAHEEGAFNIDIEPQRYRLLKLWLE